MQLRVALPAANPPDHPVTKPFSSLALVRALLPCAVWNPMTFIDNFRRDWLSNIRGDVLAGIVVALALIPEAIGFSIIAGVDPKVALYASFSIAVLISITGGRPGMISAATAATAVLMTTLVRDHGLEYLLAATILAGIIQVLAGLCRLGNVMRFVSRSVMTGFVNALAIMIFMALLGERARFVQQTSVTWTKCEHRSDSIQLTLFCRHSRPS